MKVYLVEVASGSMHDSADTMLFDSLWHTREQAEDYAREKFAQSQWACSVPDYEITEVTVQGNM